MCLNDEVISKQPQDHKWQHEDEYAYYSLSSERPHLTVYNLGVLVKSYYAGHFGIGGTIVSKKQLDINFARNDIIAACPTFKQISAHIRKQVSTGAKKKSKLTDAERDMLVRSFIAGELSPSEALKLRAITDVHGRNWPISKLLQIPGKFSNRILLAERGDLLVETAQKRGVAFSIDQSTLERFGARDTKSFIETVARCAHQVGHEGKTSAQYDLLKLSRDIPGEIEHVQRDDLKAYVSADHIALRDEELSPGSKVLRYAIERGYRALIFALQREGYEDRTFKERQIRIGRSDTALAWTDGTKVIWIDEKHAQFLRRGYSGAYQIALTLLHEQIHEGPDTGTHQHDYEFYQAYHDMSSLPSDPVGTATEAMTKAMISRLQQHKKKLSKSLLKKDDHDLHLEKIRDEIMQTTAD